MRYPLLWFLLSDAPRWCIRRTIRDCRGCPLSPSGCRFGSSGSSGVVGRFLRLRWSSCVAVPEVRKNLGRCRYRYICCSGVLPVANGCRPKRSGLEFRDCLKRFRIVFSDGMVLFLLDFLNNKYFFQLVIQNLLNFL